MNQIFVCPFSEKPLVALSDYELGGINEKIQRGELFFQSGAPLSFPLKKAYLSSNRVYLYAEIEGILLLKKSTAIVERNRVENPLIRFTEVLTSQFFNSLGLEPTGALTAPGTELPAEPNLGADELRSLYTRLPKQGHCLVTAASAEVDELHNLIFGANYQYHVHLDHDPDRLKTVAGKLRSNTRYVLCDPELLPFESQTIDGYFSFNTIEGTEKETQKETYHSLKSALKEQAPCICIVNEQEKNHFEALYKSDIFSGKLRPWKKSTLPRFYFQKACYVDGGASASASGKRSFGSQLSQA